MSAVPADKMMAFLSDPASYPHKPASVNLLQTHISFVAMAPPHVYKVKKPVTLGFLDFTTLEKRKFFCDEELRLNRRLCGSIYEAVVPIFQNRNGLTFQGDGDVVEYAVQMQQLSDGRFMHQLLRSGALDRSDLDRVVRRLVDFYARQESTPEIAEWGRVDRIRVSTDENFSQTVRHVESLITRPAYEALEFYVRRFFDCHAALFARRRAGGHILDCHGDLHAEHVHIDDEGICIYDCIEFNERLRFIDIANDIAFLAMDLDFYDRPDLSGYFSARMSTALDDQDLLRMIGFYKCYRAYVRGKVEGMRSAEAEVPENEREASRSRARHYYRLAMDYAVSGDAPMVLIVTGRVGTGKSTQAQALGEALGWPVVSSDRTRKESAGIPIHERPDDKTREKLYSETVTSQTYETLLHAAIDRGREHRSTILDATYGNPDDRKRLRAALQQENIRYRFVEITASAGVIRTRLRAREGTAGVVSDARLEDFETLTSRYIEPGPLEDVHCVSVSSEQESETTTLEILRQLIRLAGSPS